MKTISPLLEAPLVRLAARAFLLAGAFFGPGIAYTLRLEQIGDAKIALDGFIWGLLGGVVALMAFAMTFNATAGRRLAYFSGALVAILFGWWLVLFAGW